LPEIAKTLRLSSVLDYLDHTDREFLTELNRSGAILNEAIPNRWAIAQIARHLIQAERMMLVIWKVVPALQRFPRLLNVLDTTNTSVWRLMGMKIIEPMTERITPANALDGKFRAPAFLSPPNRRVSLNELIARRRAVRNSTLKALTAIPEPQLQRLSWSLPHSGSYTLVELVQFIGIHEAHHLPQIRQIRDHFSH